MNIPTITREHMAAFLASTRTIDEQEYEIKTFITSQPYFFDMLRTQSPTAVEDITICALFYQLLVNAIEAAELEED
jgi:predicted secreted protein